MAGRDVVVVGASTGGVEALTALVRNLPAGLPAAVFIVLHVRPDSTSMLPAILNRAGNLPAAHAVDGEPIRRGRIYVAPPGFQTYLRPGRIEVRRGPRENMLRPAADPLFRTAAHHYGDRVIGVVLSGALDDGTIGVRLIKNAGGIAIVQDPEEAVCRSMPESAASQVPVDYVVTANEIGPLLSRLVNDAEPVPEPSVEVPLETAEETTYAHARDRVDDLGKASGITCPECNGALWEIRDGETLHYRCRVGHAYSSESLLGASSESVERALWSALRALEERSSLLRRMATQARARRHEAVAVLFDERAEEVTRDANAIHDLIGQGHALEDLPDSA